MKKCKVEREKAIDKALGFEGPLLSPADMRKVLGITANTFTRWLTAGMFPKPDYILGTSLKRWKRSTLKDWLKEQTGDRN